MRLVCVAFLCIGIAFAQDPPKFTANAQLVVVDVQVAEKGTGKVIDLLRQNDFEILDEGRLREIKEFHVETTPLDLVFLLYSRGAMTTRKDVVELQSGLRLTIDQLRPDDRIAVLRSHSASKADLSMTSDQKAIRHALLGRTGSRRNPTGRGDRLYDAAAAAAELLPRGKAGNRHRAIIALTDDAERGSKISRDPLITRLLERDATLHTLLLVTEPLGISFRARVLVVPGKWVTGHLKGSIDGHSLAEVVSATGGETIPGDLLSERLPKAIERLRKRYLLGFYAEPATAREFRSITVRLTEEARKRYPNALIRARRGYYTQPVPPIPTQ